MDENKLPSVLDGLGYFEVELAQADLDEVDLVEAAQDFLQRVVYPLIDQIHESQDPVVEAAFKAHRAAVKARGDLLAPLAEAVERVKKALGRREKLLRDREESAKKDHDPDDLTPTPRHEVTTLRQVGVSSRPRWRYRVTHEEEIKREYLAVDDRKINVTVQKFGRHAEQMVGGIKVEEDEDRVTIRRKK